MDPLARAVACGLLLSVGCGNRSALSEQTSRIVLIGGAGQGGRALQGLGGARPANTAIAAGGQPIVAGSGATGAAGSPGATEVGFIAADASPGWADCTQGHQVPAPGSDPRCELDYAFVANLSDIDADSVRVFNDTLFVLTAMRVTVVKRAADGHLTRLTHLDVPPRPVGLELDDNRLWILHETGVSLYDVSSPSEPSKLADYTVTDGTLSRARLHHHRFEVVKQKRKAAEFLTFEFDGSRRQLLHATSPECDSVWFTEQGVWAKALDANTLIALAVESGPSIAQGARLSLGSNTLLGLNEANNRLRLVSATGSGASIELSTYASDLKDGQSPIGQSTTPLGSLPTKNVSVRFNGDRAVLYAGDASASIGVLDFSDPKAPVVRGELKLENKVAAAIVHASALLAFERIPMGATAEHLRLLQFALDGRFSTTPVDVKVLGVSLDHDYERLHHPSLTVATFAEPSLGAISYSGPIDDSGWPLQHGLQLFRFGEGGITLLGQSHSHGSTARRVFLEGQRLTVVGNDRLETFDIAAQQAPASISHILLEPSVAHVHTTEHQALVRIGTDPWTGHVVLDVTTVADADEPDAIATITLDESFPPASAPSRPQIIASQLDGAFVYVSVYSGSNQWLLVVDVSHPKTPNVMGVYSELTPPLVTRGATLLGRKGNSWVVGDVTRTELPLVPIALPEPPAATYPPPKVFFDGSVVVTSHFESGPIEHTRIYYLDRVDVSIPNRPVALPSLNVPGEVLAYDAKRGRIAVYRPEVVADSALSSQCIEFEARACVDTETNECRIQRGSIWLLSIENERVGVLDAYDFEAFESVTDAFQSDTRLVVVTSQPNYPGSTRLRVFDGFADNTWQISLSTRPSCWSRVDASARFVVSNCDYPNGCGPEVFGLDGTNPRLKAIEKSRCGGCPRALTLASSNLVAYQPGSGVRVFPLE